MQVLLGNALNNLTADQIVYELRKAAALGLVPTMTNAAYLGMYGKYMEYMQKGLSDADATNMMRAHSATITGTGYVPSTMQIASFISTMKALKAGQTIQDPNEKPSWTEVIQDSVITKAIKSDTTRSWFLMGVGLLFAYGVITTATHSVISRR